MQPGDLIGQTLGHYTIKRQIGYGGMATVFLGEDIHLGREIALKVFWPRHGETQAFLRRFTREARVLAQLDHPNILPVYDYGEQGELAFLVTPYMVGGTLKEVLQKRKALPPSEALELLDQVLPALQYAHDRNLIHRDIKPANLLFKSDGSVMLADFGLVKVLEGEGREGIPLQTVSESGQSIAGTPEYMSPEQINGRATPASDIYSLGIVLYEMVTGVRPFLSDTLLSLLMKQVNEAARPPRELNPFISPQLEAAILKALEKDPNKRFARPIDFQQALQRIANPISNPGIAGVSTQENAGAYPAAYGGQTANGEYGPTLASSLRQEPVSSAQGLSQDGSPLANDPALLNKQAPQMAHPGSHSAPTVPASQQSKVNPWLAAQAPTQASIQHPMSQASLPQNTNQAPAQASIQHSMSQPQNTYQATPPAQPLAPTVHALSQIGQPIQSTGQPPQPALQPIQAWTPSQTIAPSFVPRQPRRSRAPLAVLLVLSVLLAGLIVSLFLTPLGSMLFRQHAPVTPTPRIGVVTPNADRGTPSSISSVSTACPTSNTARSVITAPLALGRDPTIVYIVNESDARGNPTFGTVKLLDIVNGKKTELVKTSQTRVIEAQISNDGEWVLFSVIIGGQSELRLVRLDGQGLQTLLCAPAGTTIRNSQWSIDQRYVIFDEFPRNGEPTVYLLNTQTGSLQAEISPPASGIALVARTWLDNNRVLMVGELPNADATPQNIYILNIGNGVDQNTASITQVFTSSQPCWDFDSSYDSQTLFVTQCAPGSPTGSSTISKQAATGGATSLILSAPTLSFRTIRVTDRASASLLALASNSGPGGTGGAPNDGLYIVRTDGTGSPLLLAQTPANASSSLNTFSQYFWSNISRDYSMYTLETTRGNGSEYILSYGQISGGAPTVFADFNQYMAIVGWTTT